MTLKQNIRQYKEKLLELCLKNIYKNGGGSFSLSDKISETNFTAEKNLNVLINTTKNYISFVYESKINDKKFYDKLEVNISKISKNMLSEFAFLCKYGKILSYNKIVTILKYAIKNNNEILEKMKERDIIDNKTSTYTQVVNILLNIKPQSAELIDIKNAIKNKKGNCDDNY